MLEDLRCLFLEDFSDQKNPERLELEHDRLRTTLSISGNLMIGLLLFMLFYLSVYGASDSVAFGFFGSWFLIFVGMLAAFEKMFKDIEENIN